MAAVHPRANFANAKFEGNVINIVKAEEQMIIFRILYFIAIVIPSCVYLKQGFGIDGSALIYSCLFFSLYLGITILFESWISNRYPHLALPLLIGIPFGYGLSYVSIQSIQSFSILSPILENLPWQSVLACLLMYIGIYIILYLSYSPSNSYTINTSGATQMNPLLQLLRILLYVLLIALLAWHYIMLQKQSAGLNIWNLPTETVQNLTHKGYDFEVTLPTIGQWHMLSFA